MTIPGEVPKSHAGAGTGEVSAGELPRTPGASVRHDDGATRPMVRRELLTVALVLAAVHIFLWTRSLPLAYQDLSFYFEPAILLARHGWLAGPGSHYHDFTYVQGMFFYPPGFSLVLGGWIAVVGASAGSLLAYTNFVHFSYLTGLWALLRGKLRCSRVATALSVLAAFPMFGHGRADLTALLLGVLAWLLLPGTGWSRGRTILAGTALGLGVLVSPPFGISSAVAVGVYFLAIDGTQAERARRFLLLTAAAIATFAGLWAAVLTWQDAWSYGLEQFAVNSGVRAGELNHFPGMSPYLIVFGLIPLGLLTVLPAVVVLLDTSARRDVRLRAISLAYLAGAGAWFVLSKAPLLTGGHFSYLGRAPLHAAIGSTRGWIGRVGLLALLGFALIHWYHQKDLLLALSRGYSGVESRLSGIEIGPNEVVALDSDVFPYLYEDGRSVTYELMSFDYWRRTRSETSPETLAAMGVSGCTSPIVPDRVIVSARSLMVFGPPDSTLFVHSSGHEPLIERARLAGREVRFPADPAAVHVFQRREGTAVADEVANGPDCTLLPATPR